MSTKKYELMSLEERYLAQDAVIAKAFNSVEASMLKVGHAIYMIAKDELYKVAGYNTVHDYAMDRYNVSKGAVSDAVNTFKAFCDEDGEFIDPKYKAYTYSQLKIMRKLTPEQLEEVSPALTCRELQEMINASKGQITTQHELERDSAIDDSEYEDDSCDVNGSVTVHDDSETEPWVEVIYTEDSPECLHTLADVVSSIVEAYRLKDDNRDIVIRVRR